MRHLVGAGHVAEKILRDSAPGQILYTTIIGYGDLFARSSSFRSSPRRANRRRLLFAQAQRCLLATEHLGVEMPINVPADLQEFQAQADLLFAAKFPHSRSASNNFHGASGGLIKRNKRK